jgi:transcriptional regulator with XRE-family HTH domain
MGTIGDNIRRIREERGMGQSELAKASGVRPTTISNLENGYAASSKYLPRIARALDVPPSKLDPEMWLRVANPDDGQGSIDQGALQELLHGSYIAFGLADTEAAMLAKALVREGLRHQEPSDADRLRSVGGLLARAFRP